jgi:hypothetical protein
MTTNSPQLDQANFLDRSKKAFAIRRTQWENQVIDDKRVPDTDFRTIMRLRQLWRSDTGSIVLRKKGHKEIGNELLGKLVGKSEPTASRTVARLEDGGHLYVDREQRPHELIPVLHNEDRGPFIEAWKAARRASRTCIAGASPTCTTLQVQKRILNNQIMKEEDSARARTATVDNAPSAPLADGSRTALSAAEEMTEIADEERRHVGSLLGNLVTTLKTGGDRQ